MPEQANSLPPAVAMAAYEAALAVSSELELPILLKRIVELSRRLIGVRYAALGVADDEGILTTFVTSGLTDEEERAIGSRPTGKGLLGLMIRDGQPLMVGEIGKHPKSSGFPANHPPMTALLGVPILLGERPMGNLYLADREDGLPFAEEDLAALKVLAAHAATAIERARLYGQLMEARERAEEQRDQLRVILDSLPAPVLIQGPPDGRVELANAASIRLLFGDDAPTGTLPRHGRDYELLDADGCNLPADQRPGMRALRGEVVRNRQIVLRRWDGATVPLLVQSAPLRDAAGAISKAVIVLQDVTQLRQAEQLKDDFLSLISHEFRTPLTAIHGGARLLSAEGDKLPAETRQELLADVAVESDRLSRMLGNMLSLASIKAGRLEPLTEPVLLPPLIRQAVADASRLSERHRFTVDFAAGLPAAEGDPELLLQVLRNLYENAIKYSPDGGEIRTSSGSEHGLVTLAVRDHGVGIGPEHVPHLFERFRRPGADPTVRGMGLGLYLSQLLVEAQGGEIRAESPGPAQGATFTITLPVAHGWDDPGASGG
jgi:two-component system, OmpR family, phosphate regulon sensor histidine kinase PhoR